MGKVDFKDLPEVPDKIAATAKAAASNGAHLARLLATTPYPGSQP
jgi:hypothetical protein